MVDKDERRRLRETACKTLNALAAECGVETVSHRPSAEALTSQYSNLCQALPRESIDRLRQARAIYLENGGAAKLDEALLTASPEPGDADSDGGDEQLPSHHEVRAKRGKARHMLKGP